MRALRSPGAVFLILATPAFLNDFAYIALQGTYGVYLVDYGTRVYVLSACLLWPAARALAMERYPPQASLVVALSYAVALAIAGHLAYFLLEAPFVRLTGLDGFFAYHRIADPSLYWFDLTVGLVAVALSEELVFRKLALRWLEDAGRTPIQIVAFSALLFALTHWSNGVGSMLSAFAVGLLFMAAYLRLRRLWPLVVAHWAINFMAFGPL